MLMSRKRFLQFSAGLALFPSLALAQQYPAKPVRWIVGFAPGGGNDIVARLLGQWLTDRLGQPFLIDNRPGAGTNIATEAAINAAPDGYTLLLANLANAINATFYTKLKFNFIRDTVPIAGILQIPNVMMVSLPTPVNTILEFVAYAKANPGKVNMGSAGVGSPGHLAGEMLKVLTGIELVHVPYRGNGPALTDLLAGQIQVLFASLSSSIEYVKAGKTRGLGVTGPTRSDALPGVPALAEFVPDYEVSSWYGVCAPKGTPAEVVNKLNTEINAGIADAKMLARFADLGATAIPGSPADFGKLIADQTEKWGKIIRTANIRAD